MLASIFIYCFSDPMFDNPGAGGMQHRTLARVHRRTHPALVEDINLIGALWLVKEQAQIDL